jgi:hypothetical protein
MSSDNYLEQVRNQTSYPNYRKVVGVVTVIGYILGVMAAVAGIIEMFDDGMREAPRVIFAVVWILILVPLYNEISLMLVDLVDSTLDRNSTP